MILLRVIVIVYMYNTAREHIFLVMLLLIDQLWKIIYKYTVFCFAVGISDILAFRFILLFVCKILFILEWGHMLRINRQNVYCIIALC